MVQDFKLKLISIMSACTPESKHIRHWHHFQLKTLKQLWSLFLYSALLSRIWSMWDLDSHLDSWQSPTQGWVPSTTLVHSPSIG